MKLLSIRKHKSTDPVILEYLDGSQMFFSYEVPVAGFVPGRGYLVTDILLTPTTTRRIRDYVGQNDHGVVSQDEIFEIMTGRPILERGSTS